MITQLYCVHNCRKPNMNNVPISPTTYRFYSKFALKSSLSQSKLQFQRYTPLHISLYSRNTCFHKDVFITPIKYTLCSPCIFPFALPPYYQARLYCTAHIAQAINLLHATLNTLIKFLTVFMSEVLQNEACLPLVHGPVKDLLVNRFHQML